MDVGRRKFLTISFLFFRIFLSVVFFLQLTNNLQKKLNEVRREKALLEKQQMSRTELEARLAALTKGAGGDVDMSEALEEKEEMEQEENWTNGSSICQNLTHCIMH